MRSISRARFGALAAYCRSPMANTLMQELAWFEDADGKIIATIVVDADDEYGAMILARDLDERFRWIGATDFVRTPEQAFAALHQRLTKIVPNLERLRVQGDESGKTVDFFSPLTSDDKLSPDFRQLASGTGFSAARRIISAIMR